MALVLLLCAVDARRKCRGAAMSAAAAAALRAEGNALFAAASHAAAAEKYSAAADAARDALAEAVKATGEPPNPGCPEAGECVRAPLWRCAAFVHASADLHALSFSPPQSKELVLSLNNRAACHLALRQPALALQDTGDAARACLLEPTGRAWRSSLSDKPGWIDWVQDAYAKVLLRRATAFAAVGSPLAACRRCCGCASARTRRLRTPPRPRRFRS